MTMLPGWPNIVNSNQDAVRSVVQHVLETHSMTKAVEMKLKKANLGLLIASWYPFASAQRLKDITYFVCWMYVIDDAIIDKVSWPGLDNVAAFDAAYKETLDFVRKSLQLDGENEEQLTSTIPAINSFRGIGQVMCQKYTLSQRQAFYTACKLTMDGYRTEQQIRVAGRIPCWDDYWTYREGSSCINMCVGLIEFAIGSNIPEEIMKSKEIRQLWQETAIICWLTNDILSAKKELGEGFIENAVALRAVETRKIQNGMDQTVGFVREAVERFEEKATVVGKKFCGEADQETNSTSDGRSSGIGANEICPKTVSDEIRQFVKSCRCMVTGSVSWRLVVICNHLDTKKTLTKSGNSLVSPRYNLMSLSKDPEGGMTFAVGEW